MSPGAQLSAVNGVLVEALPLLELPLSESLILFGVPDQHLRLVVDTSGLAHSLDHARGVVKKIVGINNTYLNALLGAVGAVCLTSLTSRLGTDNTFLAKIVEQLAKLAVAGLILTEVVPTSQLAQRRKCAAVVAGNAVLGVADEEDEVVRREEVLGKDGRVVPLGPCVVRVGLAGTVFPCLYGRKLGGVCSNAAAVVRHRWADRRWPLLAHGWDPVLCHVLDEGALSLYFVSIFAARLQDTR